MTDILGMNDAQFKEFMAQQQAPSILNAATAKYPFIAQHNVAVHTNPQDGRGYAETWFAGDGGDPKKPEWARPQQIPMDSHGIEIFRPHEFGIDDLAGEVMHLDPKVNAARDALASSLTPQQLQVLRRQSMDYDASINQHGMSHEDALRNAVDGVMRGYVVNQWPKQSLDEMRFTPEQQNILQGVHGYVRGMGK